MRGLRFVRRVDGLAYVFVRDGELDGYPDYKRIDGDVWCRRLPQDGPWRASRVVQSTAVRRQSIGRVPL